jgi:hypothetical protein
MDVRVQFLRRANDLSTLLRAAGWSLHPAHGAFLSARHPHVRDEDAARSRLHQVGLLTSSCLRIEFGPPP